MTWCMAKRFLDGFSTVIVTVAAAVLLWAQIENRWLRPPQVGVSDVNDLRIEGNKIRHAKGTGGIVLIEFTDYECPFCGNFARATAPLIDEKLVAKGLVRHAIFNFPLENIHRRARKASEAAECAAAQGQYWEMHHRLFSDQSALDEDALRQSSAALGLKQPDFIRCLAGDMSDHVTADMAEGRKLGVNSTPTLFVGTMDDDGSVRLAKRISGAIPFDELKDVVEAVTQQRGRVADRRSSAMVSPRTEGSSRRGF